jgi:hypothetical protein
MFRLGVNPGHGRLFQRAANGVRHQTDEFPKPECTGRNLKNAHEHHSREEVFNAVFGDQGHHDNGKGASGAGNHAAPSANSSRN